MFHVLVIFKNTTLRSAPRLVSYEWQGMWDSMSKCPRQQSFPRKGELFVAQWAQDTYGRQGRDSTYRWTHDQGVHLTTDTIAQVIHECETYAATKWLRPFWYGG